MDTANCTESALGVSRGALGPGRGDARLPALTKPGGVRSRGWRTAVYLALALVALGLAERGVRQLASRRLSSGGARWIWAEGALERSEPIAFYAVRDFELDTPPVEASVRILADDAYILYVNGRRVGSGAYYAGAPLDTYPLDRLLRPGWNRVTVELRSGRGAGGLLCALFAEDDGAAGDPEPMVASDGDWRIFRDAAGVVEGTRAEADGQRALVWQSPPTGGWGIPRLALELPLYDEALMTEPGRFEATPLEPSTEPRPSTESGAPLVNDFGRAVSGYVWLSGLAAAPRRLRIDVGLEREGGEPMDVLLADGQDSWSSPEVRTLRYVGSPYLPEGATLGVVEVKADLAARDAQRAVLRRRGVFGVEPPRHDAR